MANAFATAPLPDFTSATQALGAPPEKAPLDDSAKRLKDFNETMSKETAAHDATISRERADNQKIETDFFAKNPPPVFKPVAPYAPKQEESPISAWGALAIAFGALASHFTRTPMTTALNAAGSAMKAIKEKNDAAAKASYQQWKDANEQTYKLYEYQRDAYKDLVAGVKDRLKNNVDLSKEETADYRARISAIASAFKDETSLKMLQENSLEHWAKLQDQRDKNIDSLKEKQKEFETKIEGQQAEQKLKADPEFTKMVQSGDALGAAEKLAEVNPSEKNVAAVAKIKETQEKDDLAYEKFAESTQHQAAQQMEQWKAQHPGASQEDTLKAQNQIYSSFKTTGGRSLLPPLSAEQIPMQARELGEYRLKTPSQALMARQPGWDKAVEQAEKDYPGFNPAKYDLVQKARAKLEAGKDADAIASYTRLNQHLEFFRGLVDRLPDTNDVNLLNKAAAAWGRQTGNPSVTSYETARELVGDEIVKAVTGTGAAGALGDREAIKKNFETSLGRDQLMANINAVKALVGGAIVSTREKYQTLLPSEELNAVFPSPEVMEDFHIDPATGKVKIEGIYDFGGHKAKVGPNGVTPISAPTSAPSQNAVTNPAKPQVTPEQRSGAAPIGETADGKKVFLRGGKYVLEDGTPVQ
jgi:hypothetical protein